jgi:hypothetical protein
MSVFSTGSSMRGPGMSMAVACLCQAAVAHAAVTGRDAPFVSDCTDQAANAFQWKNGAWVPIPYFPNIYRIAKFAPASPGCADILEAKSDLSLTFDDYAYGCYRITPLAQSTNPPIACVERWSSGEADATLDHVTCAGDTPYHWIIFDPGGNFQYAQLNPDLGNMPVGGMKEPMIMSVGKCVIRPPQPPLAATPAPGPAAN